jgi:hypothetical protein
MIVLDKVIRNSKFGIASAALGFTEKTTVIAMSRGGQ